MSISKSMFMSIHGNLLLENCVELRKLNNSPKLQKKHGIRLNKSDTNLFLELSKAPEGSVFYTPDGAIYSFFIYLDGVIIDVPSFEPEFIEMFQIPRRIQLTLDMVKEYKEKRNFVGLFGLIDKRVRIVEFLKLYKDIPFTDVYDIFEYVYTSSESGFELFPLEVLQHITGLAYVSESFQESRDRLYSMYDADELITVYRGQGNVTREKGDDEVQSWSLNKETAEMFATRFNQQGTVESKQILRHDVRFYFTSRNEDEVILF